MNKYTLSFIIMALQLSCTQNNIQCGDGTILKDGKCVVLEEKKEQKEIENDKVSCEENQILVNGKCENKPNEKSAEKAQPCEDVCLRVAKCKELDTESNLIKTRCANQCKSYEEEDKELVKSLLDCQQKESCNNIDTCLESFNKEIVKNIREEQPSDPVLITKAIIKSGDYGIGKEIKLNYKNNSDKTIDAIRFQYYCFNNFGEPAGSGRLLTQDTQKPGKSTYGIWNNYDTGCTKIKVVINDVHFTDDSTWNGDAN